MTYLAPSDSELTLACWASNAVGRQEIPCLIHIIPASKFRFAHFKFRCGGKVFLRKMILIKNFSEFFRITRATKAL